MLENLADWCEKSILPNKPLDDRICGAKVALSIDLSLDAVFRMTRGLNVPFYQEDIYLGPSYLDKLIDASSYTRLALVRGTQ